MNNRSAIQPVLGKNEWVIAEMPDLGELNNPDLTRQHIVDHSFIQAANGRWQLWASIRGTRIGHLFYGWEGDSLETGPWKPVGIKARARAECGEQTEPSEYMGAPFFLNYQNCYYCFYHSADSLFVMRSTDGIDYERYVYEKDSHLIQKKGGRDIMVLPWRDEFLMYTCVTTVSADDFARSFVVVRRSKDLLHWSDFTIVSEGGIAGNGPVASESPFVIEKDGMFYLFRATSTDYKTYVYGSESPFHFGVNDDSKLLNVLAVRVPEIIQIDGRFFISHLNDFHRIKMTELLWV